MTEDPPKFVPDYGRAAPKASLGERMMMVFARTLLGAATLGLMVGFCFAANYVPKNGWIMYILAAFCGVVCAGCISTKLTPMACRVVGIALVVAGVWYLVSEIIHPDAASGRAGEASLPHALKFFCYFSIPGVLIFLNANKFNFWALSDSDDPDRQQ